MEKSVRRMSDGLIQVEYTLKRCICNKSDDLRYVVSIIHFETLAPFE
jgi:hypothetical protein